MAKKAKEETADLPTMEDRAIKDLHEAALAYDKAKKARMEKTTAEVAAKNAVRDLMHQHKRTHYAYDGIEVTLEPPDGEEKVRVKVIEDSDAPGEDE